MRRITWMKQSRQENITYLVVWGMLFAAPLLSLYVRSVSGVSAAFDWSEVLVVWKMFAAFLLMFLVHNFLLAPLLVYEHKRLIYFAFVAVMIGAFSIYQCNSRPEKPLGHPHHEMMRPDFPEPPDRMERPEGRPKPSQEFRHADSPPPIVGERDILAVVVLILMLGANLGVKNYFRSRDDRRRLTELEKQNLEQQLEYLRYQINPHFFMNTLNNIHALVDIDPAKAQETIVELSKMMRFLLYEGNKDRVPLTKELEFVGTYIKLMKLRYTDKVCITTDLPNEVPDRMIPPLILISFVENAFKHGVSYQHESFIDVKVTVEGDMLHFICRNSKTDAVSTNPQQGGVGLVNVKKRLELLYGHDYMLHIHDDVSTYAVDLVIPVKQKS